MEFALHLLWAINHLIGKRARANESTTNTACSLLAGNLWTMVVGFFYFFIHISSSVFHFIQYKSHERSSPLSSSSLQSFGWIYQMKIISAYRHRMFMGWLCTFACARTPPPPPLRAVEWSHMQKCVINIGRIHQRICQFTIDWALLKWREKQIACLFHRFFSTSLPSHRVCKYQQHAASNERRSSIEHGMHSHSHMNANWWTFQFVMAFFLHHFSEVNEMPQSMNQMHIYI